MRVGGVRRWSSLRACEWVSVLSLRQSSKLPGNTRCLSSDLVAGPFGRAVAASRCCGFGSSGGDHRYGRSQLTRTVCHTYRHTTHTTHTGIPNTQLLCAVCCVRFSRNTSRPVLSHLNLRACFFFKVCWRHKEESAAAHGVTETRSSFEAFEANRTLVVGTKGFVFRRFRDS
jgi:hypothetical protein